MGKKVKIIFPLDVPNKQEAASLVRELASLVDVFKVGLELEKAIGTPAAIALAKEEGNEVFADFKLNDIPNTVKGAVKAITRHGVSYLNVMANGGQAMMEAAIEGAEQGAQERGIARPKVVAVTVLTSLLYADLNRLGISPKSLCIVSDDDYVRQVVLKWAEIAVLAGVDCLLCSPWEAATLHEHFPDMEIICPGIRRPSSPPDDQKRTATPCEAVKAGATGLVIGRPIRIPYKGTTRRDVLREIQEDIALGLKEM